LSANFQHHFEVLCQVIDATDLLADVRFADPHARSAYSADLKSELARRLADRSAEELERQLMQAGCPASKVRTTRDVLQMPVLHERDMLQSATVPGRTEPVTLVNAGFVADRDGPALQRGVPALGADTDTVLRELEYSDSDIARLRGSGVI
jgi:crotonobetainyl-CoA:carnitine CoA-transferase CaiB-like acyl-CoA transferase